jgi:diguanylate cyclase (GGDEF)-like protein/PAS domain S-box-containing protein
MLQTNNHQNPLIEIYKSFFEYNPDPTYAILKNGNFILFNDAACDLTGYSREEVIGMPFSKLIALEFIEKTYFHFNEALEGNIERFQSVLVSKNKNRVIVSINIVPLMIDKEIIGIIGVTKDITKQIEMESLKKGQNKILEMVTKNKPMQDVMDEITLLFEKILSNGSKCSLMLMDDSQTKLILASAPSLPESDKDQLKEVTIGENRGTCGAAAFLKQNVFVEDISNSRALGYFKERALSFHFLSCWCIPILGVHNNVIGTFTVYNDKCNRPNERDLQLLEAACNLSGMVIQHYKTKEVARQLLLHDPLTGLPNSSLLAEKVKKALERSKQAQTSFSVLYIDLDRFKNINDTYGQKIGNLFLIKISKRLKSCLKGNDVVARMHGDEFTILLENASSEAAKEVADRIIHIIGQPFFIQGNELFISPSIGISVYPDHGKNFTELMKKAASAMYQAKKDGGNIIRFHDDFIEKKTNERMTIENYLRKALKNNEFTLHYQPKIELSTKKIIGAEALLRWNNPKLGMIPPEKFIPIAEETGLIIPIGEWVLRKACEQLKSLTEKGLLDFIIGVNLSMRQFINPNLITTIKNIINITGINPAQLDIEITESMTMDVQVATEILNELKKLGVTISIDDFGTGYSSFHFLKHFPIDWIKIDKSFIDDITQNIQSENIVKVIFSLAKTLGVKIVAEGVETKEQLEVLEKLQCHVVQGYIFSKPLPKDDFKGFLEKRKDEEEIEIID